jgi:hypothetical protein
VIKSGAVDVKFQEAAAELDTRMGFASDAQAQGVRCAGETLVSGGELLRQTCHKTDRHFTARLKGLGTEIGNLGALQQLVFVKLEGLYGILDKYDNPKAGLWRREYVQVARIYYYRTYRGAMDQFGVKKSVPLPATPLIGDIKPTNGIGSPIIA